MRIINPVAGNVPGVFLGLSWLAMASASVALAQPGRHQEQLSWDRNIGQLFQRYCYDCHAARDPSGGINLAQDEHPGKILANRPTWSRVQEMLESKQMPPEDERQPSDDNRALMIQFLSETFSSLDCEQSLDPGKPTLRRLNRAEYDLAILDLTGLDLQLAENFPPDPTGYGFDNIADTLTLTPTQSDLYHSAAQHIVAAVLEARDDKDAGVYDRIFGVGAAAKEDRGRAQLILQNFASQAFRQPVDTYYVNRLLRVYDLGVADGLNRDQSIGHALVAVLMSPRFLMRIEQNRPEETVAYRVSDYELASRLSFFLWSRPPDQRLLDLAHTESLSEPQVLRRETLRMLRDSRSIALVQNFFAQWLDLRRIDTHQPDPEQFPEFDDDLRFAMRQEIELLMHEIVRDNRPVTWLIDAPHIYLNRRLANHYGMDEAISTLAKRVPLDDRRRGGIIGSAAFLMLQSDAGRTNIPRRGNFIAGQILGDAPPPPPPDVPPLEIADDGRLRSLRDTFEQHRASPDCNSCHRKIDPLGFSLEHYDAIGRWRDADAGFAIDASAAMDDGQEFEGIEGLKDYLLSQREALTEQLSRRLLIYALGRGLEATDECVLREMRREAVTNEFSFHAFIFAIVESTLFTHRKNPEY